MRFLCFTIIFLMDVSYCFDLWMSKGVYDIFALVINFLDENWQPKKVTIGLFETTKIIGQALARNLKQLLDSYGLSNKTIAYVKDEGENLNSMTTTLIFVVNCEVFGLEESFNPTLVLVMHFPELINMQMLKRGHAKILSMSQSNMCNLIFRSV